MKEIILKEEEIKFLESFLQEMPLKYGLPILNLLNKVASEQLQVENTKADSPE